MIEIGTTVFKYILAIVSLMMFVWKAILFLFKE